MSAAARSLALFLVASGCAWEPPPAGDAGRVDGGTDSDASVDAGAGADASTDGGSSSDAGDTVDGGPAVDAGLDAGTGDAGASAPIGSLDIVDSTNWRVEGWAVDLDAPTTSVTVELWLDAPPPGGQLLARAPTSVSRADVNAALQISGLHGFSIAIPSSAQTGTRLVYLAALDHPSGRVVPLGAPKTFSTVPSPVPLGITYTLACYYMPKPHHLAHQWVELKQHNSQNAIKPSGQRRPLLGYYRGDDLTTLDWQIKFAVDRGITVFVFDDYWTDRSPTPGYEGSLRAFLAAHHRDSMQFSIALFMNNVADRGSAEALAKRSRFLSAIVPYYIAEYFSRPNYLLIEGKPAIFIGSLFSVFGASSAAEIASTLGAADALVAARTTFPGVYWVTSEASAGPDFGHAKAAGFEAVAPYYVLPYLYPTPHFPLRSPSGPVPNATWDGGVDYSVVMGTAPQATEPGSIDLHARSFAEAHARNMKFITAIATDFDSRTTWFAPDHVFFTNASATDYWNLLGAVRQLVDANVAVVPVATRTGKPIVGLGPWNEQMESTSVEPGYGLFTASNGDPFFVATAAARQFGAPPSTVFFTTTPLVAPATATSATTFRFDTDEERGRWFDWSIRSRLAGADGGMLVELDGYANGSAPASNAMTAAASAGTAGLSQVVVRVRATSAAPLGSLALRWRGSTYPLGADAFGAPPSAGRVVDGLVQKSWPADCAPLPSGACEFRFGNLGPDWDGTLAAIDLRFASTLAGPAATFVLEQVALEP